MVLWIGYLQWHFRTHGHTPPSELIIRAFRNIEERDAVLDWDSWEYRTDAGGKPVMRWDGHSTKVDPVTGRDVPDAGSQAPDMVFKNPRPAIWPEADYIIGNPPFLGGSVKRGALGQGYFEALNKAYPGLPESCDLVMYWWHKAAELTRSGQVRCFGFITTNSIAQTFNRRVMSPHLEAGLSVAFAIPDHPWVDSADGAAVRIAMTVGAAGSEDGEVQTVTLETPGQDVEVNVELGVRWGKVNADLTVGADVASAQSLAANERMSCPGMKLHGSGFIVTPEEAQALGLGRISGLDAHIRHYRNGKDLTGKCRNVMVIDLYGLAAEEVRERFPAVYQWVAERVKPERDAAANRTKDAAAYAKKWWLFGKPRETFRPALAGLPRYIATVETAKHRVFVFLDASILPDNMLVNIATEDAFVLGVLSSRLHVVWALAAGGRLGVGNDPRYNKSRCFETFPFPDPSDDQRQRIRDLAEQLDAHRKSRQAEHPGLTLTAMYNALEKLRLGQPFTPTEKKAHEQSLARSC